MQIGIFGAGGFVGSSVVRALEQDGHQIVALSRVDEARIATLARCANIDVAAVGDILESLAPLDAVVNCAGKTRLGQSPHGYLVVNEEFPSLAYRLCLLAKIGTFIHLSSVAAVTSVTRQEQPADDDTLPEPQTPYGRSKLAGDQRLLSAQREETRLLILRPPMVFGSSAKGIFGLLAKCAEGRLRLPIGSLANRRNFMFADNLADAVAFTIGNAQVRGCYIVTDSVPKTPGEFYDALGQAIGARRLAVPFPVAVLRPLAKMLLRSRAASLLENSSYDSSRFREDAHWTPRFDFAAATALTMTGRRAGSD